MKIKTMFIKNTIITLSILSGILINSQQIIPFRITKYNNIIVKTLVNDKDSLNLMFQISMEDASISPQRSRPAKSIVFKDEISENNSVKIGNLEWKNIRFYDNELTGQEADGKIGTGIFKGKIYQIDFDNNQFVIYDTLPDTTDYKEVSYTTNQDGQIFLVGENKMGTESFETNFLLQSGYSGGLLYSNAFADSKDLSRKLKITGEKTFKNSAGKSVITKQGSLPELVVTDISMKDVPAGFFAGDIKTQKVSYFGADLIRRFIWIFDAETQKIYIKPSKYFNEPYLKFN